MGTSIAGIAFRPKNQERSITQIIEKLTQKTPIEVTQSLQGGSGTRNEESVIVFECDNSIFICGDHLVWDFLKNPQQSVARIYEALNAEPTFMLFCCYDAGGSYGYAICEEGRIVRSRLQTCDLKDLPPILEHGEPTDIETSWLTAESYLEEDDCPEEEWQRIFFKGDEEVPEHALTMHMLEELLIEHFDAPPWHDADPGLRIFHF